MRLTKSLILLRYLKKKIAMQSYLNMAQLSFNRLETLEQRHWRGNLIMLDTRKKTAIFDPHACYRISCVKDYSFLRYYIIVDYQRNPKKNLKPHQDKTTLKFYLYERN